MIQIMDTKWVAIKNIETVYISERKLYMKMYSNKYYVVDPDYLLKFCGTMGIDHAYVLARVS